MSETKPGPKDQLSRDGDRAALRSRVLRRATLAGLTGAVLTWALLAWLYYNGHARYGPWNLAFWRPLLAAIGGFFVACFMCPIMFTKEGRIWWFGLFVDSADSADSFVK